MHQEAGITLIITVVNRKKIKKLTGNYITSTPELAIEIDTKADNKKFQNPQDYLHMKTQDLLNSGVKKVIWIFTPEKKIWVAEKGKRWFITDWDDTIDLIGDLKLNLKELLKEEEIEI